jgi:hypothetical protein
MGLEAFVDRVVDVVKQLTPKKTLIELTNQRAFETTEKLWDAGETYDEGELVEHDGTVWNATESTTAGQEPGVNPVWEKWVPGINDDVLLAQAEQCAAEVEDFIAGVNESDALLVGYTAELVRYDLAWKSSVTTSDLGIAERETVLHRIEQTRNRRRARQNTMKLTEAKFDTKL